MATDREKILQSAQKYVDKKRYDRAIEEYQRIIEQDPNDARTLLKIGDLQTRMQAYAEAIATYDRVGQYYSSQGFSLKAIAVYKQIRELLKKHAPELNERYAHITPRLAEIYTQLGLTSDALAAYDEVATRMQRAGRDREAIDVFQKMVGLDGTNPLPHLRLAEACCRVQELDQAIESFWTAAELLIRLERHDDALKVVERILHFRQDARFARIAAELYLQRQNKEDGLQALTKLQICFQADPRDLDTLGLLAQAFTVIGQEAKSIEVYKEMARISRDAGRLDLFEQLIAHLSAVAPNDEAVQALMNLSAPQGPEVSVSVVEDEVELLEELEEEGFEAQQPPSEPLRPHHRPMASAPDVVVVDGDMDGAEEYGSPDSFDALAHARKAVIDAESFRKLRLFSKATETLRIALEIDPRSLDIRDKLRQVLLESGDADGAIGETVTLAAIYLDQAQPDLAEPLLYEVLNREPQHPAALEMLQQINTAGYDYSAEEAATNQADGRSSAWQEPGRDSFHTVSDSYNDGYDPNEPLPSYDLEEIRPSHAMASEPPPPVRASQPNLGLDRMDDPFGEPVEAPLPSFPLGAEDDDLMAGLDTAVHAPPLGHAEPDAPLPSFSDPEEHTQLIEDPYAEAAPVSDAQQAIEEALEEAEFFASRGLYDDARAILTETLGRSPNHPLLLERLQELEQAAPGQSGTIERAQFMQQAAEAPEDDRAFDIAASLDALDQIAPAAAPASTGFQSQNDEIDVDQVFAKFKEGVRAQVSESDSATHYDLGVAYKEMGLLNDAVNEFELAARDPVRECMCYAMIGMIQLEAGAFDKATAAYIRGLEAPGKTVEQEMSLYYDLGTVYEMKQSAEEALYYFKKIARRDPGFRDVKDRIAALEPAAEPAAERSRAVNDDDEFDKVFDDLFETK